MEEFIEAVRALKETKYITTIGKVSEVNGTICTVTRDNLPPLEDVRLNAINSNFDNVFIVYPKVGSEVLCLEIENQPSETCIVKYTEIDKVEIKIKKAEFIVENGKFTVKNDKANLKQVLSEGFSQLKSVSIITPHGPGSFSPADVSKFTELEQKVKQLFA